MKTSFLFFIFGIFASVSFAQTTTVKQGVWSDPNTWNNSSLPGMKSDVVLQHDITIDANGFCKSLNTNGHKVRVNSDVHLSIGANPWDSTLLVSITNISYFQGYPPDSTFRTIRNSYVDGEKKILITEIDLVERTDTFYTLFTYNKLDQLTSITDYASDEQFGVYERRIDWAGNRVDKITSEDDAGTHQDQYHYTPSGSNTIIDVTRSPASDSVYDDPRYVLFDSFEENLTLNSQSRPVSKAIVSHSYFRNTEDNDTHSRTTTVQDNYSYDADSNIVTQSQFRHSVLTENGLDSDSKDTSIYSFTRNAESSASVNQLLHMIFGTELQKLVVFFDHIDITQADVLGNYSGERVFNYTRHELKEMTASYVQWDNGVRNNETEYNNMVRFQATNQFDANKRLVSSIVATVTPPIIDSEIKFIYPK